MPSNHHELEGYRSRLQRELALAIGAQPISGDLVERLVRQLAEIDRALALEATA